MARSYRRDGNGRFAGGGGNAGGKKAASSRAANNARSADLKAKGTTGLGSRVKAKGFQGGKSAQDRAGGLRSAGQATVRVKGSAAGTGAGSRTRMRANATAVGQTRSRAASSGGKKMSKAPANPARDTYKALSGEARKQGAYRSAAENKKSAGARRRLNNMVARRGRKG